MIDLKPRQSKVLRIKLKLLSPNLPKTTEVSVVGDRKEIYFKIPLPNAF